MIYFHYPWKNNISSFVHDEQEGTVLERVYFQSHDGLLTGKEDTTGCGFYTLRLRVSLKFQFAKCLSLVWLYFASIPLGLPIVYSCLRCGERWAFPQVVAHEEYLHCKLFAIPCWALITLYWILYYRPPFPGMESVFLSPLFELLCINISGVWM